MGGIGTEPDSIDGGRLVLPRPPRRPRPIPMMDDFLRGLTDEEQKQALERANRLR